MCSGNISPKLCMFKVRETLGNRCLEYTATFRKKQLWHLPNCRPHYDITSYLVCISRKILFEDFRAWLSDISKIDLDSTIDMSCAKYEFSGEKDKALMSVRFKGLI